MSLITFTSKTKIVAADVNSNFTDVKQITIRNEDLSSLCAVPPARTNFPTAFKFQANSLAVYWRDGATKTERFIKGVDYNEDAGLTSFTIISGSVPTAGDKLVVDYTKDI
jgi:hypothetical protein